MKRRFTPEQLAQVQLLIDRAYARAAFARARWQRATNPAWAHAWHQMAYVAAKMATVMQDNLQHFRQ